MARGQKLLSCHFWAEAERTKITGEICSGEGFFFFIPVQFYSPSRFKQTSDNHLELGDEPNSDSDCGFSEGQPFLLE